MIGIQDKELELIPNLRVEMMVQEACQLEEMKAQVSQQSEEACAVQEVVQGLTKNTRCKTQNNTKTEAPKEKTAAEHVVDGAERGTNQTGK